MREDRAELVHSFQGHAATPHDAGEGIVCDQDGQAGLLHQEAVEVARRAEAAGARSFWIAEHLGYREAFITATAIALATEKARLLPTAISPYLRHPTPMAMALASLAE